MNPLTEGEDCQDRTRLLNLGVFSRRPINPRMPRSKRNGTIIVTGVARSGTSLIAALLKEAGLFMGAFLNVVVSEDPQILGLLRRRDLTALKLLVRDRNAGYSRWGFKIPNLHAYLRYDELRMFRNPHLIIVCRDPVAVGLRNALSEHYDEIEAMVTAANATYSMMQFASRAACPVFFLSYEKILLHPDEVIERLLRFCGLSVTSGEWTKLLTHVRPSCAEYMAVSTSTFQGRIDGIVNGQLYGWCWQKGHLEPVRLQVFADGHPIASVVADTFRDDLMRVGVGNGCHGFYVPLSPHCIRANSTICVTINNRALELENSGVAIGYLPVISDF